MDERRKYQRLKWSVEVHWKKDFDGPNSAGGRQNTENTSVSKDISAGGIRLILREGIQAGDILEMEIRLGPDKTIQCRGKVAWVEKFVITGAEEQTKCEGGVQFLDISEDTRIQINNFIFESHKPEE